MKFFDVSRPTEWKWPAVAFVFVSGVLVVVNAVPYDSMGIGIETRGWPLKYWSRSLVGSWFDVSLLAADVAFCATLSVIAASLTRAVLILGEESTDADEAVRD
ncbi:hypothetical protein [Alienimonas chondri]|uniref:Uncharacterized protein n=1 Tax=Alienimonas chondri TaxID=2681879 RepID=A0ABX1VDL6_9PLAN|nr:hypothetical protein [Alienimonas chondri]NNJ26051.1 hypothetical protein [Alienimonas chondri]